MRYCILMGSPRKNGNTSGLLSPFLDELSIQDAEYDLIWLYDKQIEPCIGCRSCQKDWTSFGCIHRDDVQEIFSRILLCDVILLATPIYSWYCTPPMKALLDRLVYGMNKYYGEDKGPSLWRGKRLAVVTTCGYPPEKGADLFQRGMERYCRHSQLTYVGMLSEHDPGPGSAFMDEGKERRAREFALKTVDGSQIKF